MQLAEIETALNELNAAGQNYKIIGNIMVLTDKEQLKKDLTEKKETLDIRISTIEKQEEKFREKVETLQKEILANMEQEKKHKK